MTLTSDEITICNLAMGYIGEYQVTASGSTAKQYVLCDRFYDDAVEETLLEHTWNEAKKRSIIMQDTTDPIFGFDYQFTVPSDCLKLIRIGDGDLDWDFWEVENGKILTNAAQNPRSYSSGEDYIAGQYISEESVTYLVDTSFTASGTFATDASSYMTSQSGDYKILNVEYVYNLTTTTSWSPRLKQSIAQTLALKVITGITNDPKSKQMLMEEFEGLTIKKARSVDAQQGRVRPIIRSRWWRSRFGWGINSGTNNA